MVYDRDHSAISLAAPSEYDFEEALRGVTWVHVTGITPSLSENAYLATLDRSVGFASRGLLIPTGTLV